MNLTHFYIDYVFSSESEMSFVRGIDLYKNVLINVTFYSIFYQIKY